MNEENQVYFVDSDKLPAAALERKHRLEQDPSFRTNHMEYMEGMQVIQSDIKEKVLRAMEEYDYMGLMTPVRSRISRRFYLRLLRRIWSRWPGKRRRLPRIISEIRSISLHRCISQIIARITVFTADSTVTTISGGKS